jgi:hypothetical protein
VIWKPNQIFDKFGQEGRYLAREIALSLSPGIVSSVSDTARKHPLCTVVSLDWKLGSKI